MKKCTKCGIYKEIYQYHKGHTQCKLCRREIYIQNRDKRLKYAKEYYELMKEFIDQRDYRIEYYKRKLEADGKVYKPLQQLTPEEREERRRKYHREYSRKRYKRKREAEGKPYKPHKTKTESKGLFLKIIPNVWLKNVPPKEALSFFCTKADKKSNPL